MKHAYSKIIHKLIQHKRFSSLRGDLTQKVFGTFGLKILSLIFSFVTSVFLSRTLGVADYGKYAYGMVWLSVLSVPASLGIADLVIREVAICQTQSNLGAFRGLLVWSNRMVIGCSVSVAFLAATIAYFGSLERSSPTLLVFLVAMASLPLTALSSLRKATLQGLHKVVVGQIPEMLLQPVLFISVLACAYFFPTITVNPVGVMTIRTGTVLVSFLFGSLILSKVLPQRLKVVEADYRNVGEWFRRLIPFLLISATVLLNTRIDAIMLGAIEGTESVGIYTVVTRGADLVVLSLIVVSQSIRPRIAQLWAEANHSALQSLITKSARITAGGAFPIALFLIVGGEWYLSLFGQEFLLGKVALSLLSLAKLLSAFVGSVGLLLSMTGYERDTSVCVIASSVVNVSFNCFLIPLFGMNGAAFATLFSSIVWNISLSLLVYKRLGISPGVAGGVFSFNRS